MARGELSERIPTVEESRSASQAAAIFAKALEGKPRGPLQVSRGGSDDLVELPPSIAEMVVDLLSHIARGEMVALVSPEAELTTQQAADLLNVSRPHLTKLLEANEIPFHRVGSHRRVHARDLFAFKARRDARRATALKELQRLGQDYDAG